MLPGVTASIIVCTIAPVKPPSSMASPVPSNKSMSASYTFIPMLFCIVSWAASSIASPTPAIVTFLVLFTTLSARISPTLVVNTFSTLSGKSLSNILPGPRKGSIRPGRVPSVPATSISPSVASASTARLIASPADEATA